MFLGHLVSIFLTFGFQVLKLFFSLQMMRQMGGLGGMGGGMPPGGMPPGMGMPGMGGMPGMPNMMGGAPNAKMERPSLDDLDADEDSDDEELPDLE